MEGQTLHEEISWSIGWKAGYEAGKKEGGVTTPLAGSMVLTLNQHDLATIAMGIALIVLHASDIETKGATMNSRSNPEIVVDDLQAGVDWLTVTVKDQENRAPLYYECARIKDRLISIGERYRPWSFKGYAGYMVAGLRWGTRLDSDIAMLSGADAHQNWYVTGEWATNCSRIDLAVTVELQSVFPSLLRLYNDCLQRVNGRGVKYGGSVIYDSDGGCTLYVQRRSSHAFGRIYDKGIESGLENQPGKLWRYEVEFHKPLAKTILSQILSNKYVPPGTHWNEEVAQSVASTVYTWYLARNIPPVFSLVENRALSLEVEARVVSDGGALDWLTTQVRPTVGRRGGGGKT